MRIPSVIAAIAVAVTLAGCSSAALPAEPVTEARVSSDTWLVMTDNGIGPITSGAPYQKAVLSQVVAGSEIVVVDAARETGSTRTEAAFINGQQAVQFFKGDGNTVGEIHGVSQHLTGPNGERIGMTMGQAGMRRSDCRVGTAVWRGMAVCNASGARHITLVFSIPEFDGPFDTLPSDEQLARAELQRIVWRANA